MNKPISPQNLTAIIRSVVSEKDVSDIGYVSIKALKEKYDIHSRKLDVLPPRTRSFIILVKALKKINRRKGADSNYKKEAREDFERLSDAAVKIISVLEERGYVIFMDEVRNRIPVKELAAAAGLGKIAKNTLFISDRFGPSVQIVILAADIQIRQRTQKRASAYDCLGCEKCMTSRPGRAISKGKIEIEACRAHRRSLPEGTDCGICMKICQREFEKRKRVPFKVSVQ